jgi:nicotinamide riboside kinase
MLIGFTGAQCTGKSTLLSRCSELKGINEAFHNFNFVQEVTRKVKREGHKINLDGNDITQLMILNEHLNNHTLKHDMLLDRCILDGYVYTSCLARMGKVSEWITTYACNLLNLLIDKIDVIFYTQPEDVPLVADGTRSVDLNFRQDIINRYEDLFAQDYYWMDKVVRLSGTVEDRMGTILETIQYENSDIRQFQNI